MSIDDVDLIGLMRDTQVSPSAHRPKDLPSFPATGYKLEGRSKNPLCMIVVKESKKHPGFMDMTMFTTVDSVSTKRPVRRSKFGQEALWHFIVSEAPNAKFEWETVPDISASDHPSKSVVYFIADEDGYIKIGKANDVKSRLKTFQTSSRQHLRVVATIPGGHAKEGELHKKFKHLHVRGEWFAPARELKDYIVGVSR